jgi:hypothetical protein
MKPAQLADWSLSLRESEIALVQFWGTSAAHIIEEIICVVVNHPNECLISRQWGSRILWSNRSPALMAVNPSKGGRASQLNA